MRWRVFGDDCERLQSPRKHVCFGSFFVCAAGGDIKPKNNSTNSKRTAPSLPFKCCMYAFQEDKTEISFLLQSGHCVQNTNRIN